MNIKKALIPTGKAIPVGDDCGGYVTVFGEDLYWFDKRNNGKTFRVSIQAILNTPWLPYFEDDDIVPENVGELWKHENGLQFATVRNTDNNGRILFRCCEDDYIWNIDNSNLDQPVAHGKSGWTRAFPQVEEIPEDEEIMDEEDRQILEGLTGEPEFPFWVRISDCSGEDFWYNDKIGNIYKVYSIEDYGVGFEDKRDFCTKDGELIKITDCEKVGVIIKCLDN